MFDNLEGLLAITLSLAVPIIAILMVFISEIKKKRHDTEVRLALIQQGTDAETAKILIEQQPKKNDKYSNLRAGFILVGIGLGAAVDALIGLSPSTTSTSGLSSPPAWASASSPPSSSSTSSHRRSGKRTHLNKYSLYQESPAA